jgi:Ca2+-binding RTX toxin-like protein
MNHGRPRRLKRKSQPFGRRVLGDDSLSGGDGNDTIGDVLTRPGNGGADTIDGGDGDDRLVPADGADLVVGGAGNDTVEYSSVSGTSQSVSVDLEAGFALDNDGDTDTLIGIEAAAGTAGGDSIRGNAEPNDLRGFGGADTIFGLAGADTIAGGAGNDRLDGGSDADTVVFAGNEADFVVTDFGGGIISVIDQRDGQPEGADTVSGVELLQFADTTVSVGGPTPGDDVLEGTGAADIIDAMAGSDAVLGLAGNDRLLGNEGDDTLDGGADNDTLIAGNGNDSLDGGTGADSMAGGAGNDLYLLDNVGDRVAETRTGGADTMHASLTWTLGAHVEALVLTGTDAINGTGNSLPNTITGNGEANTLLGGGRADTLVGGGGNDLYLIDATDVLIEQAGGGHDTVVANATFVLPGHIEVLRFNGTSNVRGDGNAENNFILGNLGNNRLLGHEGDDTLNGGAGNDTLQGGEGADSLVGGEGSDRLDGGNGDDTYLLMDTDHVIELANAGIDTVLSNISYVLPNGVENLTLLGSADIAGTGNALDNLLLGNGGANLLRGLAGADSLAGGQAGDTLEGGAGADTLAGSGGADRFLWLSPAEGGDVVTDFRPGDDKLAFAAAGFGGLALITLSQNAAARGTAQFVYTKETGVLEWDADGTGGIAAVTIATLSNKPTLAATDFVIV